MLLVTGQLVNIKYKDFVVTDMYDQRDTLSRWCLLFGLVDDETGFSERFRAVIYKQPIKFKGKDIHIEIFDTGKPYVRKTLEPPLKGM